MFRSLYISLVYAAFFFLGASAPFVLGLGYVWVDTFTPQSVAYSILTEFPVSAVMAVAAFLGYLLLDRKAPPRLSLLTTLTILMAVWVTITTMNDPASPVDAWFKWNWAIKVLMFTAFMPLIFRSRVQIESFLQIYLFAMAAAMIPYGAKTILSGGSYGANLGLIQGNSGLAEGAFLSTNCMMIIPFILHLARFGQLLPRIRITFLVYAGLAVAANFGTLERTGLIGLAVTAIGLWLRSKRRVLFGVLGVAGFALVGVYLISSAWSERMETLTNVASDRSAYDRILVWKWTLGFVADHPLGGGFNAFMVDRIVFPGTAMAPEPTILHGIAFHSMYFEVLGEHGWPGLFLFLSLILAAYVTLIRTARLARRVDGLEWCRDLAWTSVISLSVFVICGAFIGIAFTPELYYMFALPVILRHHVRMAEKDRAAAAHRLWLQQQMQGHYEAATA
jgi:putative inorganic carbon (HCO3(-)) transporter